MIPDFNFVRSQGAFNRPVRRLSTYTIHHNPACDRYIVKDDKTGKTAGAGYKSPDDAEKAFKAQDMRRLGFEPGTY